MRNGSTLSIRIACTEETASRIRLMGARGGIASLITTLRYISAVLMPYLGPGFEELLHVAKEKGELGTYGDEDKGELGGKEKGEPRSHSKNSASVLLDLIQCCYFTPQCVTFAI